MAPMPSFRATPHHCSTTSADAGLISHWQGSRTLRLQVLIPGGLLSDLDTSYGLPLRLSTGESVLELVRSKIPELYH